MLMIHYNWDFRARPYRKEKHFATEAVNYIRKSQPYEYIMKTMLDLNCLWILDVEICKDP